MLVGSRQLANALFAGVPNCWKGDGVRILEKSERDGRPPARYGDVIAVANGKAPVLS